MTLKPAGNLALADALLREQLDGEVTDLTLLTGGQFSQAFSCTVGGRSYVLRLNDATSAAEGFAKDDYAWRHFASSALPIPRVTAIGRTADGYFAISERAAGRTLDRLTPDLRAAVLPRHVEIRIQGLLVVKRAGARGLGRRLCRTGAPSRARSSSKGKTP